MTERPAVRYRLIDRQHCSPTSLDEQLPLDHPVRLIWDFVCQLDLGDFLRPCRAVQGHPGAPLWPPQLLFALWLYGFVDGTLSARRLARLCRRDLPFQWLCGGDPVNYHTLADFYSQNQGPLRQLFVEHVAALLEQGLIGLQTVTLDGRKVPANASKDHLHREPTLQAHLDQARAHLAELEAAREQEMRRGAARAAARRRGARERVQRLERALAVVRERQQQRRQSTRRDVLPEDARASETDPDAAKMKFPNGGYGLAYNVETVSDEATGLIVTVAVTNQGSDNGQLAPLLEQVRQEQGVLPERVLLDSGFADAADVEKLEKEGVEVLMPPKNERKEQAAGKDPYAAKRRDSAELATWRARMGTAEARTHYRRRAPVAEGVHAQQSNRGWRRFRLRGQGKAQCETCWQALAHNVAKLLRRGEFLRGTVRAEGV
ncbi:MAG TPA: transposase [Gemmataceae bacterium]|nr:transposase [Gemmataceae bacterium]